MFVSVVSSLKRRQWERGHVLAFENFGPSNKNLWQSKQTSSLLHNIKICMVDMVYNQSKSSSFFNSLDLLYKHAITFKIPKVFKIWTTTPIQCLVLHNYDLVFLWNPFMSSTCNNISSTNLGIVYLTSKWRPNQISINRNPSPLGRLVSSGRSNSSLYMFVNATHPELIP